MISESGCEIIELTALPGSREASHSTCTLNCNDSLKSQTSVQNAKHQSAKISKYFAMKILRPVDPESGGKKFKQVGSTYLQFSGDVLVRQLEVLDDKDSPPRWAVRQDGHTMGHMYKFTLDMMMRFRTMQISGKVFAMVWSAHGCPTLFGLGGEDPGWRRTSSDYSETSSLARLSYQQNTPILGTPSRHSCNERLASSTATYSSQQESMINLRARLSSFDQSLSSESLEITSWPNIPESYEDPCMSGGSVPLQSCELQSFSRHTRPVA